MGHSTVVDGGESNSLSVFAPHRFARGAVIHERAGRGVGGGARPGLGCVRAQPLIPRADAMSAGGQIDTSSSSSSSSAAVRPRFSRTPVSAPAGMRIRAPSHSEVTTRCMIGFASHLEITSAARTPQLCVPRPHASPLRLPNLARQTRAAWRGPRVSNKGPDTRDGRLRAHVMRRPSKKERSARTACWSS